MVQTALFGSKSSDSLGFSCRRPTVGVLSPVGGRVLQCAVPALCELVRSVGTRMCTAAFYFGRHSFFVADFLVSLNKGQA